MEAIVSDDLYRWSNDNKPPVPRFWVWGFELHSEKEAAWAMNRDSGILLTITRKCSLHAYNPLTREYHCFSLPHPLCQQLAILDLDFWSCRMLPGPESTRLNKYMAELKEDVMADLWYNDHPEGSQIPPIIPWAVRTCHQFGHCLGQRDLYLNKCHENDWNPYAHDDPLQYRAPNPLSSYLHAF